MIFAYNKEQVGDVLLVILEDTKDIKRSVERKGKVARVTADETGKTLAWNIFEASSLIDIEGNGQVFLSDQDVAVLNEELAKEGFEERLENTQGPVFVVGQIDEMVAHPDSDHLNLCQVNIGDKKVQIVAGAPNAALGLKTIVALPGAMMPSGALIFPGKLRGEDSYGACFQACHSWLMIRVSSSQFQGHHHHFILRLLEMPLPCVQIMPCKLTSRKKHRNSKFQILTGLRPGSYMRMHQKLKNLRLSKIYMKKSVLIWDLHI